MTRDRKEHTGGKERRSNEREAKKDVRNNCGEVKKSGKEDQERRTEKWRQIMRKKDEARITKIGETNRDDKERKR